MKKIISFILLLFLSWNIFLSEMSFAEWEKNIKKAEIKKYVKILPKTWNYKWKVETKLPSKETFRLAWSKDKNLETWLKVLNIKDRNENKYIIIPSKWLIMPIKTVGKKTKEYKNFITWKNEDFNRFLAEWSVELPWTTLWWYWESWNKVIAWHSSFWKNAYWRYKTHFQKIIWLEKDTEIWVYERNKYWKYDRFIYKTFESYDTKPTDVNILKPTKDKVLTLFTCTPIWWVSWRWIVKSKFIWQD